MKISKSSRWVMIGDSITDCGRVRPVGEGKDEALGKGYVNIVDAMLTAACPQLGIRVTNMGLGGNTVRGLKERWQTDVIDLKPDWLSIMIGINDVWRHFDRPKQKEILVGIEEYEQTLTELVERTLPLVKGMILMTPYFLDPNPDEPMRAMMDRYGCIVKKLAKKHAAILVDTQAAFDSVLQHVHPMALALDRVHPALAGHAIIARALLKALDFQW